MFTLAFLFRLQLWSFAFGQSPWTDLFKVDILNCMGFAIALMSVMAIFTTAERVRLCAGLGVAIAAASPLVSAIDWRWLPPQFSAYFVPSYQYFAFFPWASFIAFGLSIGSILRLVKPEQMNRVMQWGGLMGFGLIIGGQYFSNMPYSLYPKSEFWLDSPGLIVIKLGVVMLVIGFAYLWTALPLAASWSWVRQLGTTSLLVYWVHIELVYGRWFGGFKGSLEQRVLRHRGGRGDSADGGALRAPYALECHTRIARVLFLLTIRRAALLAIKQPAPAERPNEIPLRKWRSRSDRQRAALDRATIRWRR